MAELSSPQEKPEAPDFAEAIAQTLALPQDEAWICASCTAEQPRWEAQCPNCRTVGSIDWRAPLRPRVQSLVELSGNRARITHNPSRLVPSLRRQDAGRAEPQQSR